MASYATVAHRNVSYRISDVDVTNLGVDETVTVTGEIRRDQTELRARTARQISPINGFKKAAIHHLGF